MASVMSVLRRGHERKRFAATAMNDRSSRSHTAFIVQITQTTQTKICKVGTDQPGFITIDLSSTLATSLLLIHTHMMYPQHTLTYNLVRAYTLVRKTLSLWLIILTVPTLISVPTLIHQATSEDGQQPESSSSSPNDDSSSRMVKSQLHLVDLAGSERVKKVGG